MAPLRFFAGQAHEELAMASFSPEQRLQRLSGLEMWDAATPYQHLRVFAHLNVSIKPTRWF